MFVSQETAEAHKKMVEQRGDDYDPQNPFSKILRGEAEAEIVSETPYAVTIKNNQQRTDSYNLVLPVFPAANIIDFAYNAPKDHALGYQTAIEKAVQEIYSKYHSFKHNLYSSCARVVFNIGPNSQNSVNHLHAHVMGDENLVGARQLTLSEERAQGLDEWLKKQENISVEKVAERLLVEEFQTTTRVHQQDGERIKLLRDGQVLGWKESSYLDKYSQRGRGGYWSDFVCFLLICGVLAANKEGCDNAKERQQSSWGGRAVIDVHENGYIIAHATAKKVLKRLPALPLTNQQLLAHYQNVRS